MKRIYFIRHAKSEQNIGCSDFDRPLSARGERDAPFMAERLGRYGAKADIIVSSSAKRAISTARLIAEKLSLTNIITDKRLYLSNEKAYLEVICALDDDMSSVFLVGHNPVITEICEALSGEFIGNIPTCGIFALEFDLENFKDIGAGRGKKLFFDYPKKYLL